MSDSLRSHELQYNRLSCPSLSPGLLKLMSIESMMPANHLVLCHPLLLPSIFPSIRVFSRESALCITWPKYWSFSLSTSTSNEYSSLISFGVDWFDILILAPLLHPNKNYPLMSGPPRWHSRKESTCQLLEKHIQSLGQEGHLEKEMATHKESDTT